MNATSLHAGIGDSALPIPSAFLVFRLGAKKFGLDAAKVRELLQYDALTKVADDTRVKEEVVIWRANVVPVVDMRVRFNFGTPVFDERTCVVILEIGGRYVGMAVDSVAAVIKLGTEEIKPVPSEAAAAAACLFGLAAHEEDHLILLDIDKLLDASVVMPNQKLS